MRVCDVMRIRTVTGNGSWHVDSLPWLLSVMLLLGLLVECRKVFCSWRVIPWIVVIWFRDDITYLRVCVCIHWWWSFSIRAWYSSPSDLRRGLYLVQYSYVGYQSCCNFNNVSFVWAVYSLVVLLIALQTMKFIQSQLVKKNVRDSTSCNSCSLWVFRRPVIGVLLTMHRKMAAGNSGVMISFSDNRVLVWAWFANLSAVALSFSQIEVIYLRLLFFHLYRNWREILYCIVSVSTIRLMSVRLVYYLWCRIDLKYALVVIIVMLLVVCVVSYELLLSIQVW